MYTECIPMQLEHPMNESTFPDFWSRQFLNEHARSILRFYEPRAVDPEGGFFHSFTDEGEIADPDFRHLVSSTRFAVDYSMMMILTGEDYLPRMRHALDFLAGAHLNAENGGYCWSMRRAGAGEPFRPEDDSIKAYGLAFVLLAYSYAVMAGLKEREADIGRVWDLLENRFYDERYGLYFDEYSGDFSQLSPYRGQNANMHLCEAFIAAWKATGKRFFLERACLLARNITLGQTKGTGGLVWEHYDKDWGADFSYNQDNPKDIFKPWGFQPGHQAEWAKLLSILYGYCGESWMIEKAEFLFSAVSDSSWDDVHGGLYYSLSPDMQVCDDDKYYWVQAESISAAAMLWELTGKAEYRLWYERIWRYSWNNFADKDRGGWYRILFRDNRRQDNLKSPPGKTDYHTIGMCFDLVDLFSRGNRRSRG
jgi:mannose/cellobiose epimerase-like protein (N-acyl-D-glucosamine 2-epimerase family)